MRSRTLLTQVLAVNAVLVGATAFVAAFVARNRFDEATSDQGLLLLALAVSSAILLNSILLRQRLAPVNRLVRTMDRVDLLRPGVRGEIPESASHEVQRLTASFNRMLARVEEERRDAGRAVLRAQEQERARIAQDLHDEVNQALTAILLRLSASASGAPAAMRVELEEIRTLASQAMDELLQLARQLRPTALDDHGLIAALASQVREFSDRTGIEATFRRDGTLPALSSEEQLVIYRVTQECLNNVEKHAGGTTVTVELNFVGRTILRVRDNGHGFDVGPAGSGPNGRPRGRPGGLGLSGMRERALLIGGSLTIFSHPGEGTTIELTMGNR